MCTVCNFCHKFQGRSTACFATVRLHLLALFSRKCTACYCWTFACDFCIEKKKGVRLGLLSTFPDFVKKFAGGDKLYFSPFSVLYFAEE